MLIDMLQEIKLTTNASLAALLNHTFNAFRRHHVGALATFDHEFTAPGCYWVTVLAHRVAPDTNESDTVTSNISVVVSVRPTLLDEAGRVLLLLPSATYVNEPLTLIVLIQHRIADVSVTANYEDDSERSSMNVVETATTTTLQDVIESADQYRNLYRIAADSRPPSTNVDQVSTLTYARRDVVHVFRRVGGRRITVTVSRRCASDACGDGDRFTVGTEVTVRRRPSLADELGAVLAAAREPVYVNESVEFVYAVQRPHPELEYRLDFGDRSAKSTVPVNSTINHLPEWLNSSGLELPGDLRELLTVCQPTGLRKG